jgi:hypothetical protein
MKHAFLSLAALLVACSGSDGATGGGAKDTSNGPSGGETKTPGGSTTTPPPSDGTKTPPPAADPSSCQLPELTGIADVTPTFQIYDPAAGTVPPAMKGGKADGKYKVDKAVVFLPTSVKGLAKPATSKGTINSWAIFDGKSYRLSLKADLSVDSVIGPQPTNEAVDAAGTFTVVGEKLQFDSSCDTSKAAPDAELTFNDEGARATLVVKTHVSQGDVYIQLDAAKQ